MQSIIIQVTLKKKKTITIIQVQQQLDREKGKYDKKRKISQGKKIITGKTFIFTLIFSSFFYTQSRKRRRRKREILCQRRRTIPRRNEIPGKKNRSPFLPGEHQINNKAKSNARTILYIFHHTLVNQVNKFRTFISVDGGPSPQVVVSDSSEFIDGLPSRRFSGKGLLLIFLPWNLGVKLRSRSASCITLAGPSGERRRFCDLGVGSWRANISVHSEASSGSDAPPRSSGIGFNAPPRSTVSTAAWQTCQLPVQRRPTAPLTGLTVLPAASNNRDWNRAVNKPKKIVNMCE